MPPPPPPPPCRRGSPGVSVAFGSSTAPPRAALQPSLLVAVQAASASWVRSPGWSSPPSPFTPQVARPFVAASSAGGRPLRGTHATAWSLAQTLVNRRCRAVPVVPRSASPYRPARPCLPPSFAAASRQALSGCQAPAGRASAAALRASVWLLPPQRPPFGRQASSGSCQPAALPPALARFSASHRSLTALTLRVPASRARTSRRPERMLA